MTHIRLRMCLAEPSWSALVGSTLSEPANLNISHLQNKPVVRSSLQIELQAYVVIYRLVNDRLCFGAWTFPRVEIDHPEKDGRRNENSTGKVI